MRIIFILIVFLIPAFSFSQNTIGLPDIINYNKQTYKAGIQNRQIDQDNKGRLYFANNDGLLIFDGKNWNTYPLPNKTIIRSLKFSSTDNKLYVGGQDEFGYFSPNQSGQLTFHSLKHLIPISDRSFTDVWKISFYKNNIFFLTSEKIYQISGKNCTIYKSDYWNSIAFIDDKLFAQDSKRGLLIFNNGVWSSFHSAGDMKPEYIVTSLNKIGTDSILITTLKNGIYLLNNNKLQKINSPFLQSVSDKNISCATMVNEKHIALGTNLAGCFIIDKKGNLIQSFSSVEGLKNNNVLDIFLDKEKNLWLGLDNGIDFISYNNAIKHIYPNYLNEGSGYAASIFNNELYIGTSNGLSKVLLDTSNDISYCKGKFSAVNNTKGQVWNLSEVNGTLLMGHHEGGFIIKNNTAVPLDNRYGYWTFQPYSNIMPSSIMVAGTYNGLNFYNYASNTFANANLSANFQSARFVVIDNGNIWVAHPYKGIFKIWLDNNKPQVKNYTSQHGVTSSNGNFIFKIQNRIILTTEKGIYEYNTAEDKFEASTYYNNLFPGKSVRYLKEDNSGNIWFVFDKILGVVDVSTTTPKIIYFPELTNKFVSGFEFIYPINNKNVLVGGEKGFYHINYEQYKKIQYPLHVQITLVKAFNERDSILYGGYDAEDNVQGSSNIKKTKISYHWNSFHFAFAAPVYAQLSNIEYSYSLMGFDDRWSDFSQKTEKEYTNLPAGNYVFKVKARNNLGKESNIQVYNFTVLPPWYQSNWAYGFYVLMIVAVLYILDVYQKKKLTTQLLKHQEEQKRLQYLHQLELENTEKELIRLRNEKLEAEILHKNTELASTAMHLVQKGELLGKVKDQMLKLKSTTEYESDNVKKILRTINDEGKMDEKWEQFSIHFDNVHSDFLITLKNKYPSLSNNEMKLCAYLRMNLSTKEIAQLMNISVRGVEISRYRLRKKLNIPKELNLFEFLLKAATPQHV